MTSVIIVDYGMGNLRSVQKAIEHVGGSAQITADPGLISAASHLILPGVGAFRDAIQALHDHNLVEPIRSHIDSGKPFLGICLGLQMLLELSHEDGQYPGFGVIPGHVRRFDLPSALKIPHMGWNQLQTTDRDHPLFEGISPDAWFYFVHSYYVDPTEESWVAARTEYGRPFVSMIRRDNVFATQFHPEKSQKAGLKLLSNFISL